MSIPYAPTSWNPVVGCEPVSEGCKNCWARRLHNQRHRANTEQAKIFSGLVESPGKRRLRSYEGWKEWVTRVGAPAGGWAARARKLEVRLPMPPQYDRPFDKIQLFPDRLDAPPRWRKPRTVAVCFMGDLFHPEVPDEFIDRVFAVAAMTPRHRYLYLTKRAARMQQYLSAAQARIEAATNGVIEQWGSRQERWNLHRHQANWMPNIRTWPLPNVWLGVTAENQRMADERIPLLLGTPGKHWVSLEPLLEGIDIEEYLPEPQDATLNCGGCEVCGYASDGPFLDGVVVGGESGPGHRRMDLQWATDLQAQCAAAGTPFYMKQIAASRPGQPSGIPMLDTRKETGW